MELLITILFLILSFLVIFIYNKRRLYVNLPPGKFGWPIIGETAAFVSSMQMFVVHRMNRYSPAVFKTSIMGERMAIICDAPGNKFVFSNQNKDLKRWVPDSIKKIVAPNLKNEASYEEEMSSFLRAQSKFLSPQAVHLYVEMMDFTTRNHMDSEWAPNSTISVYPVAKKLAFSLACGLFMGLDYTSARIGKMEKHFKILSAGLFSVPINFPGTAFRRAVKAAEFIRGEIQDIVRTTRLETSHSQPANNYMSLLLSETDDHGKLLSECDIANKIMSTLIASHETTSSLFTNMVYYLADHPHVYDLALKEQIEIRNSKGDEKLLTWDDTKKMRYGRNIINEVLRIATPTIGHFRDVIHDTSYEGFTIPKGWKIYCPANSVHKNSKYFPKPEKFDPTRFEGNGPAPYTFIPFGGGEWLCPGHEYARQTAFVFLHNLLINFKWEKLCMNEKMIKAPLCFPEKGLPIKLQQRGGDDDAGAY